MLDALTTIGPLLHVPPNEIKEHVKQNFLVEFEVSEIINSGDRLEKNGYIEVDRPESRKDQPRFKIANEVFSKISKNTQQIKKIEEEVIGKWKTELITKYKEYPTVEKNIDQIVDTLNSFLTTIIISHGVECVNLLYPENSKANSWLSMVKDDIFAGIGRHDSFIDTINQVEIPKFLLSHDEDRKTYLYKLFNSSFYWHLIQVDEKCSMLFREVTEGQKLFLDNNVLFSIIGLHGINILQSTHSMLKFANDLGYKIWITTKTIDEFHESLSWQMRELNKKPPVPRELAKIATKHLGDGSLLAMYWNELVSTGVSVEEFIAEKSHLEKFFSLFKIRQTNSHRMQIEGSKELEREEKKLTQVASPFASDHIIEHDAYHRVFINRLRKRPRHHFRDAKAWFLTEDRKLPAYDRVARKGKDHLPFCLTIDQWIQVNRPLLARTANREEYEKSFRVLVTQPYLRSMGSTRILEKAYHEVIGRLGRYERMNPKLAAAVVADSHFMLTMGREDKPEIIDEKLDSKFLELAIQFEDEKIELAESKQELIAQLDLQAQDNKSKIDRLQEEVKKWESTSHSYSLIIKWVLFGLISVSLSYLIWGSGLLESWNWIAPGKNLIIFKIIAQIAVVILSLLIPLIKYWKYLIGTLLVALLLELLSLLSD